MASHTKEGLPYESRDFTLTFKLNNILSDPTEIHIVVARINEHGKPVEVATATKVDLNRTSTGIYTYSVVPGNYGEHYLRVWTSGDVNTKDKEYTFNVPEPHAKENLPTA